MPSHDPGVSGFPAPRPPGSRLPGGRQAPAFVPLGRACYFTGVGTPSAAAAAASARERGWVGFPVYLPCNSCVFNTDSPARLSSWEDRTPLHLLNTRLRCAAAAAGLCEVKIRRGGPPPLCGGRAPRRRRAAAGSGQPRAQASPGPPPVLLWGLGGPGCQYHHLETQGLQAAWPSLCREPRGFAHAGRKEMKRGSETETKGMRKSQGGKDRGIPGQKTNTGERGH